MTQPARNLSQPTQTSPEPRGRPSAQPAQKSALREYGEAIVIAVILAVVIRTFLIQAYKIPSGSMEPST